MGRVGASAPAEQVMEVVTPRTNTALLSSAEHLFAGLTLQANAADGSAVSLEIVADSERRRFLLRTGTQEQQRRGSFPTPPAFSPGAVPPVGPATLSTRGPRPPSLDHPVPPLTHSPHVPQH